jgi:hypothetical protein
MNLDPTRLASPEDCVALYERGFEGYYADPAAEDALLAEIESRGGFRRALGAISHYHLYGAGERVLSLPYLAAMRMYPQCLPGGSQARGDCVSWSIRSASIVSYCASLLWGDNTDRYAPPAVSDIGRTNGVFATESWYWFRGHSGEGWNCGDAARIAISKSGMMVRKNYPEIGIDLEEYSGATAGKWGARTPPDEIIEVTSRHLLSTATVCKTWEEVRDMLANGYALATCGGEAFERTRDEFGVCRRSNSVWRHAMSYIAADDREEMKRRYKCREGGLVLVQNSWANYCGDEHPIPGTQFKIPAGSFWARWDDVRDRYMVAIGGGKGFAANAIPRLSLASII